MESVKHVYASQFIVALRFVFITYVYVRSRQQMLARLDLLASPRFTSGKVFFV